LNKTSWKVLVLSAALLAWGAAAPAWAVVASSNPTLVVADATAAPAGGAAGSQDIAPMPDAAVTGAWCLGGATAAMAGAYALGPSEIVMMVSGAMHVPSSGALLFIPLYSILAGGSCAVAAAAEPAVLWAMDQSDNISAAVSTQFSALSASLLGGRSGDVQYADAAVDDSSKSGAPTVRPMTEGELQGAGCVVGSVAGFGASLASSPMEVVMLAAGGITVASTTPILAMGLLGTIVASSCGIGNLAVLPVVAFFNNFSAIGDSLAESTGQVGHMVAQAAGGVGRLVAALGRGGDASVQVAEGNPAAAH